MPAYRIENMTKHNIYIAQANTKSDYYTLVNSYHIIGYSFSHPMNEKVLRIAIETKNQLDKVEPFSNQIASVYLDSFKNNEMIKAYDRRSKTTYIISIKRERTMKIVRIQEQSEFMIEHSQNENDELHQRELTFELRIPKLGISVINSSAAEELMYIYIKQIDVGFEKTKALKKFKLEIVAAQIENQMTLDPDQAVILRKDGQYATLISLNYCLENNEGFEHFIHFKEFNLSLCALKLFLESSFWIEVYMYFTKIFTTLSPLFANKDTKHKSIRRIESKDQIMKEESDLPEHIIYFEYLYIDNIKIKFGFESKPEFLHQTQINDTLKVVFATLMNMKSVSLDFQAYVLNHTSNHMSIFMNNIKKHYISECLSQKQLTNILLSIGIFGTLRETISNLTTALAILTRMPNRNGNVVIGIGSNIYNALRYLLYSVSNVLKELLDSAGQLNAYLYIFGQKVYRSLLRRENEIVYNLDQKETDGDDIKIEFIHNVNSLAASLNSQNKIWLKIIINDKAKATNNKPLIQENQRNKEIDEEGKLNDELENIDEEMAIVMKPRSKLENNKDTKGIAHIHDRTKRFASSAYNFIKKANNYIRVDQSKNADKRIRHPRYFSITKELEPYSAQKAFAIQIMKYDENIISIFTLKQSVVIFTESRLLVLTGDGDVDKMEYWSLLYTDILSAKFESEKVQNEKIANDKEETKVTDKKEKKSKHTKLDGLKSKANLEADFENNDRFKRIFNITILHFYNENIPMDIYPETLRMAGNLDFKIMKKFISSDESDHQEILNIHKEIKHKMNSISSYIIK